MRDRQTMLPLIRTTICKSYMKNLLLLGLCLASLSLSAQRFEISGTLVDKSNGDPLESATLFVERPSDSTLVSYTISGRDGAFAIEGSDSSEQLRLVASYAGYGPYSQMIRLDQRKIDLGNVELEVAENLLDEVMVVGTRAPVTVKKDTLEFNAASFNTRQDANLEELIKKLPGMEVATDGSITLNGTPVSRVLVNGKEFFGNDPQIATKNLPKEIIDKIQVMDAKTKEEEFTGKAGNPDDKTINITLQEDKNRGYFARATVGGGTDGRYEMSGIGNYFQDDMRMSVLASSNNINSSGFSFDEVFDMMGGGRRQAYRMSNFGGGGGGGGGITKSETAGLNFTNDWNDKFEVNADYFFGRNDTETSSVVEAEYFRPSGNYFENSTSSGNLLNDSHRASASFEIEIDTLTKISVRPSLNINNGFSQSARTSERLDAQGDMTNSSETSESENLYSSDFSNQINFIRRFGSRGAYLQGYFSNDNRKQENENFFHSERMTYSSEGVEETQRRNQLIDQDNKHDEYRVGFTQRSVLADELFLDISYDYSTQKSTNIRNVFDMDDQEGSFTNFNEDLSNAFEIRSVKHRPNVGLNYESQKWRAGVGVGYLSTSLDNKDQLTGTGFDRNFENIYLNANIRYEIKRGSNLWLSYRNDTDIPSIRQLQPVADITNPLHTIVGNPELRPSLRHNINLGYRNFDWATRSGFSTYGSVSMTEDQVVSVTTEDEQNISTTTYTNLDGGVNANVGSFYSKRYEINNHEFNYRLGAGVNYAKQVGFAGGERYTAKRYGLNPSVRLGYNYMEIVELTPRYELSYNLTEYDMNLNREEEYMNHSLGFEATTYWPENLVFGNDISYNYFGNVAPGFDPTAILWNVSLGYQFLEENATLKIKVYDLLNENVSTSRTTGQDFVRDTEELILKQYFMLSFTYKLNKFGGQSQNRRSQGS